MNAGNIGLLPAYRWTEEALLNGRSYRIPKC